MGDRDQQFRNVCFTLNNYSSVEYDALLGYKCDYLIMGKEKGEQGTPHIQGYMEFRSPRRLSTIKKFNPRLHLEERRGSQEQAITYCKKEGDYIEVGKKKGQGERTDLDEIAKEIIEGHSLSAIALNHPATYIRYSKGIEQFKSLTYTDRTKAPYVEWRYGEAGVGKSYYCVNKHPSHYIKDSSIWWNGYTQQEAIIIDDFDGHWNYRDFLRLLDRYAYQGQYKGGYIKINSPYIYITCEHPPSYFWTDNELAQVERRIDKIEKVENPILKWLKEMITI